jgi:hypothetical protein
MSPGCVLLADREMTDRESWSSVASTIFTAGICDPTPLGNSGFETKTRNLSLLGPLLVLAVVLEELEFPQETIATTAASTKMVIKTLFKPGTPKGMRDRDLDARKRIITERLQRILPGLRSRLLPGCKSISPLVF